MSLPRWIVVPCPSCEMPLELSMVAWSVVKGEREDEGPGVVLELAAWTAHRCDGSPR